MIDFNKPRDAIAMIELIFSIVVMGIVMMSAPMLISTASKTTSVALQQEGVHEAASRVNMIMTHEWDENALNGVCSSQPPILKVTNGDEKLKPSPDENSSFVRAGTSDTQDSHRFDCLRNNQYYYSSTSLNKEESSTELPDDIDDFQNSTGSLVEITSGTGGVDYIEQETVNIATAITYANDTADYDQSTFSYAPTSAPLGNTTNIKLITVTLTSTSGAEELDKNIVLQAFSCNIGSFRYHKRVMP